MQLFLLSFVFLPFGFFGLAEAPQSRTAVALPRPYLSFHDYGRAEED